MSPIISQCSETAHISDKEGRYLQSHLSRKLTLTFFLDISFVSCKIIKQAAAEKKAADAEAKAKAEAEREKAAEAGADARAAEAKETKVSRC